MTAPAISVVLATRNRDYVLAHTLTHLARTSSGSELGIEIVVADNGSSDCTQAVLSFFSSLLPLVVVSEPKAGKNRALNRALGLARGTLVVFTDDDVIPETGWLESLHAASERWNEYQIFGGRIVPRYPPGRGPALPDREFAAWAYSQWEPPGDEGPTDQLPFGPNFAVRAAALQGVALDEEIGPGVGPMGSETTLLKELVGRGCRIVSVPGAAVQHLVTPSQLEHAYLLRRAFGLGRGIVRWSQDSKSPRIGGVPRYLWREVAESWIRGKLRFADAEARLRAELAYQRARGKIFEYRQLSR